MNRHNSKPRVVIVLLAGLLASLSVSAATITVDSTADTVATDAACTLREAINNANGNSDTTGGDCIAGSAADIIEFNIGGGGAQAITLTSVLPSLTDSLGLTIDGSSQPGFAGPPLIDIDANGTTGNIISVISDLTAVNDLIISNAPTQAVHVNGAAFVTIDGLNVAGVGGNSAGQGIFVQNSSGVMLLNNVASDRTGGIYLDSVTNFTVTDNVVSNSGANYGLRIWNGGGSISASGNNFTNSTHGLWLRNTDNVDIAAAAAAGIEIVFDASSGLDTTAFSGMYIQDSDAISLDGVDLSGVGGNSAGQGLQVTGGTGVTVTNIDASGRRGGIYMENNTNIQVTGNNVQNSAVNYGLRIWNQQGTVSASTNNFTSSSHGFWLRGTDNVDIAAAAAAGIEIVFEPSSGLDTTTAFGMHIQDSDAVTLDGVDVSGVGGNTAGQGLQVNGGTGITVTNVDASDRSGGLYFDGNTNIVVNNNTATNSANNYALRIWNQLGTVAAAGNMLGNSASGVWLSGSDNLDIAAAAGAGVDIVLDAASGLDTTTNIGILVQDSDTITIDGIDVSGVGGNGAGQGMQVAGGTGITVTNVDASDRSGGLFFNVNTNIVVNNNTATNSAGNYGLRIWNQSGTVAAAGNMLGNSASGLWLLGSDNLDIAATAGAGVDIVLDAASGLDTVGNLSLFVQDSDTITIDGIDVSGIGGNGAGQGLQVFGGTDITVTNVDASDRTGGLYFDSNTNIVVNNNTTTNSAFNYGLRVWNQTGTISVTGNDFTGSQNGAWIRNTSNQVISDGSAAGTTIALTGLDTVTSIALLVQDQTNSTIDTVDVTGPGTGTGIVVNGGTGVIVVGSIMDNRTTGIRLQNTGTAVSCNSFQNNITGILAIDNTGHTLFDNIIAGNSSNGINAQVTPALDAANNYWGSNDGSSSAGGTGDSFIGTVTAVPFLAAAPACVPGTPVPPPEADLAITKTTTVIDFIPGGAAFDFMVTVTNNGPDDVTGARVVDTLPLNVTSVTWTCAATGLATCTASGVGDVDEFVDIPNGESVVFTITVSPTAGATVSIDNTAEIFSPSDTIIIGDRINNRIQLCDDTGNCTAFGGTPGAGLGEFNNLYDVDVGPLGEIIVADAFNNRIQICDDLGVCTAFGTAGGTPGQFNNSRGVAVDSQGRIIVADSDNSRIQVCDFLGTCTAFGSGGSGLGQFLFPWDVAVDSADRIIVADRLNDRIQICNDTGTCTAFGTTGTGLGQFMTPTGVAVDSADRILITDLSNTRVQICNDTGTCTAFGSPGTGPGQFQTLYGIAADSQDRILVGDEINNRVSICDDVGTCTTFGSGGGALGQFNSMEGLAVRTSGPTDTNLANNSAMVSVPELVPPPEADLAILKTANVSDFTPGGPAFDYTVTVTNNGPDPAIGANVVDTLPLDVTAATWTCIATGLATCTASGSGDVNELVDIPNGESVVFTITVSPTAGATVTINNTAQVIPPGGTTDPVAGNDSATLSLPEQLVVLGADLVIDKTASVAVAFPGDSFFYTLFITNTGPGADPVAQVTDNLPAGITVTSWSCSASVGSVCSATGSGNINDTVQLQPGGVLTYTINVQVLTTAPPGPVTNTANVVSSLVDPVLLNNSASATITIEALETDLSITKLASVTEVMAGSLFTYTISVSNLSAIADPAVQVTDNFPAEIAVSSWSCSSSAGSACTPGGSGNINDTAQLQPGGVLTYSVNAQALTEQNTPVTNTASVSASLADANPLNNVSSVAINIVPAEDFDLTISKTDGLANVAPGGELVYTITVNNLGTTAIIGARVTDILTTAHENASWSCVPSAGAICGAGSGDIDDLVDLPVGGSIVYTLDATVASTFTGDLFNTAQVAMPLGIIDQTPADNMATDVTMVLVQSDLAVSHDVQFDTVIVGEEFDYQIIVQNVGPSIATDVLLDVTWPDSVELLSVVPETVQCGESPAPQGQRLTQHGGVSKPPKPTPLTGRISSIQCALGDLLADGIQALTFSYLASGPAAPGQVNTAVVSTSASDFEQDNNSADATVDIVDLLDLQPSALPEPQAVAGELYTANLAITGGLPPFSFSSLDVPDGLGLTMQPDGRTLQLSGVPERASSHIVSVSITDAFQGNRQQQVTRSYPLDVTTTLNIQPENVAAAQVGVDYLQILESVNGVPPILFSADQLPDGLALSGDRIAGIPGDAGNFSFTVDAMDASGNVGSKNYDLLINPAGLNIDEQALSGSVMAVSYGYLLSATTNTPPLEWVGGAGLPEGMQLQATGFISGQPLEAGVFPFSATVSDAAGNTATGDFELVVLEKGLVSQNSELPPGLVGVPYEVPTAIDGGVEPYFCVSLDGNLPPGLVLNGCNVGIDGVPNRAGTYSFTILVEDSDTSVNSVSSVASGVENSKSSQANQFELGGTLRILAETPVPDPLPPVVPAQPANVPVKPLGQPGPEGFPDEVLQKLVVDGYGNRYMAGYSFNGTDYDIRVLKYTAGGSLLWDQEFDFGSQEFGFSLAVDPVDQHVYVGGYGVQFSLYEAILLKLDLAGVLEWKVVNGTDSEVKTYYDLAADSAGVYAAGERYNGSNFDAMVAFHQPDGALVWESVRNSNDTESAYSIELSACEGCPALVAGSHGGDFAEGWVDVIDLSTGALSNFSGDTGFAVQDLAPGEDSVLVGGSRAGDYVIASLTGGGDETWRTTVPEGRQLRAVVADRSGFIYAVGNTEGPGERDAFVVLMDQEGNVLSTQPLDQGGSEALHAAVIGPEGLLTTAGQSSGGDNNNNFLLILYDTGKSLLNIAQ